MTWLFSVTFILLGTAVAWAQLSINNFEVKTAHIFPAQIEANGWKNIETLTFQNLDDYALLQEFNAINSATIDTARKNELEKVGVDSEVITEEIEVNETQLDLDLSPSSTEKDNISTSTGELDKNTEVKFDMVLPSLGILSSTTELEIQTTTTTGVLETGDENVSTEINDEMTGTAEDTDFVESTTTVLRRVESVFNLAVEAVTSIFEVPTSTREEVKAPKATTTEETDDSVEVKEMTIAQSTTTELIAEDEIVTENKTASTTKNSEEDHKIISDENQEAHEEINTVGTSSSEIVEINDVEVTQEDEVENLITSDSVGCTTDCSPYVIKLGDFGYPLDEKVEISGAQLRLSFAALKRHTREETPEFHVMYSVDNGLDWKEAGSISIYDEVSNSINGGYYLLALPEITSQETLNNLMVQLVYRDDPELVKELYVESVWLELFTLEQSKNDIPTTFAELLADDGYEEGLMSGDVLELPSGEVLDFNFTDNNRNETLIIKTDKKEYSGLSEATTYFSVTNISDKTDDFTLQTYFPEGDGNVVSLDLYNKNKARDVVVTEYRPYIYHCEDGWEYSGEIETETLQELSEKLSGVKKSDDGEVDIAEGQNNNLIENTASSSGLKDEGILDNSEGNIDNILFDLPALEPTTTSEFENTILNSTTTVLNRLPSVSRLLQYSVTSDVSEFQISSTSGFSEAVEENQTEYEEGLEKVENSNTEVSTPTETLTEEGSESYVCRNTNVVRECDELEGDNTACRINQVKIQDHNVTRYSPGWDTSEFDNGTMDEPGFFRKVIEFIGFGPDKKEVPTGFEARMYTPSKYEIEPGETLYYKMDISFPAFSTGEYWIEAIGDSEYGLLDPFWSSSWDYRIPISVSNTTGAEQSEYQMFMEIDSTLSDFWANVNSDGSDIRFVQELEQGNLYDETGPEFQNPYDNAWSGRIAITIPSSNVDATLADYPVFVDLSTLGSAFWSGVSTDGADIRITKQDGKTELAYDLVEIDATNKVGELHFLADTLDSNSDNIFHIYFDNPSATAYASTSQYGSQKVWNNYEAVYHFSDDPTNIGNIIGDETGNGQDLEVQGAALATTTGAMGTAIDMTVTNSAVLRDTGDDWAWTAGDDMVSTGLYYQTAADSEAIWEFGTSANPNWAGYMPWYTNASTTGRGYLYFGRNAWTEWARDIDVWHHFTTIAPSSIGGFHGIYDNGTIEHSQTQSVADPSNLGGLQVGRWTTGGTYQGVIDELRIASNDDTFTSSWVTTEYLNHTNPSTFYSTSTSVLAGGLPIKGWYSTSWDKRIKLTLPQTTDQVDFPVYLDLSILGSDFWNDVASDGRDIRIVTGDNSTELPYELVSIDTGAKTGELYFKTDLTEDSETSYYIYYDNSDAVAYLDTATYGAHNVWTNGYQAVYHFEEGVVSGSGNIEAYKDSTGNEYHGDDYNTSDDETGVIGKGLEFGDTNTDYVKLPYEVMDGLTDISVSGFYMVPAVSATDERTLLSAASTTEDDEFRLWLEYDTDANEFYYTHSNGSEQFVLDNGQEWGDGLWDYFMVSGEDSIDEVNFWLNGAPDDENPDPQAMDELGVDPNGLVLGQEQYAVGSFVNTNEFIGNMDEIRISSVIRDDGWADAAYENLINQTSFIATSSAETQTVTDFDELDFWVQHFDSTNEEADIWVQVDDLAYGEDTVIYLYYGNTGASSASDEMATFTYSTSTDIFHVVDDHGATTLTIQSLIDNNEVVIDGNAPIALDRGESTSTTTFDGDTVVSILGPISGTVTGSGNDGGDMLAPISFATTSFAIPTSRSTDQWFVYAPFASTTARIYEGASASALSTANIATGTSHTFNVDITNTNQGVDGDGAVIEASSPVLLTHRHTTQGDGLVAYPPTTRDIFGLNNQYMHFSALVANSDPTLYCSAGAGGVLSGITRGDQEADASCTSGSQGSGAAVRATGQASAITALSQADADGNESTVYWPQHEFGTRYAMTNSSAYAAVVCSPRFGEVDLEVLDSSGNFIESGTCAPGTNNPGKTFFNNGNGTDGNSVNFLAGGQIVSTNGVPFMVTYEDVSNDQDEKNISGPVQARKYGAEYTNFIYGEQEIANDAEYDQLSFMWYLNSNDLTPTTTWPTGDSRVSEGEGITGEGAVGNGDTLRVRINLEANNATGTINSAAFSLQYGTAETGQCSTASNWHNVGELGSTTAAFRGYNNVGISDGTILSSTTLSQSTVFGSYEEENFSELIKREIGLNEIAEWDWVIEAVDVAVNTNYCFRMVRAGGNTELEDYTLYPELETVGPPNTPELFVFFDNERTDTTTPVLEFSATDIATDDIHYYVEVDNDKDFSSPIISRNSDDNFLEFENLSNTSDKAPFASGNTIRFTSTTDLSTSTTYWWRVRAEDPDGSATTSAWSSPYSFTEEDPLSVSEWYQTTGHQFTTNILSGLSTTTGGVSLSSSPGTMTSTAIDFDDATVGNAWGEVSWNDTVTSGTSTIQIEYNSGGTWTLIPDSALAGNSVGISTSPINILALDTDDYNEIRLVSNMEGTIVTLEDWSVKWGLRVETPTLGNPFDNQKTPLTSPVFDFVSSDPQGDDLDYEISISTDYEFSVSSSTFNSATDVGFANVTNGADTEPFSSGDTISYTVQTPLSDNTTYWWRVRAKDPTGGDSYSPWSDPDSFTASTSVILSTWFQTTEDQFFQGTLDGTIASTSDSVEVSDQIGEYGTITATNNDWQTVNTNLNYKNMAVVASPEFDGSSYGNNRNARVRNKTTNSFEIKVDDYTNGFTGSTVVDYMVMEAGTWTLDEGGTGIQVIAGTAEDVSDVQARSFQNNIGTEIDYSSTPFSSAPVGIATVSSDNDTDWIGTHIDGNGADHDVEITTTMAQIALNASYDGITSHGAEDVDYVIMDVADGTINGGDFEAFNSADQVDDVQSKGGYTQSFQTGFGSTPQVTLVHNNAEDGGDGGFCIKDTSGTSNANQIFLSTMEAGAGANGHTQEIASIIAFEGSSGILIRLDSGNLSGTIAGENIIFSDGAGPKYDNFSWLDTTPATSDILYQMEYLVDEDADTYALIPDSQIPGNSSGTTTSPIDLTGVDINTYDTIRSFATLTCGGGGCPILDEWQLEWSEGVNMSGTLKEYDRLSNVATGTIKAAVNGVTLGTSGTVAAGVWSLENVTAFDGDVITVWVDGATESEEAVSAFVYDGLGDITGVELFEQHLSISADEYGTTTNALLALNDSSALADEDIFYQVDSSNNLTVCGVGACSDANLYIGPGNTYIPDFSGGISVSAHDLVNDGSIELDSNTFNVSGSWENNATSTTDTSTINMTAATGTESISSSESPLDFHNLTFGSGAGDGTFTFADTLDLSGNLTVTSGTLSRDDYDIYLAGSLTTGANGIWSGTGTTTFDGSGAVTWTDNNLVPQNIGNVIIDGASTFVSVTTDVAAYDVVVGANDTLAGGTGNTIYVGGDWDNNGVFVAGTSKVQIEVDDRTYPPIVPGSADWYSDTSFSDRIPITVDSDQVTGDLTNFPIYIDLSLLGDDFWDDVSTDGRDIRITEDDGQTELPYDLVEIDSTTKTGELHFLSNSLSSSASTTFYIYHNNSAATAYTVDDTYGRNAVWADYEAVYHFNDDVSTVGNTVTDASGHSKDMQVSVEALATTTGKLGTAVDLTGTSNGYMIDSDWDWIAGDRLESSGWYQMSAASSEALWAWGTGNAFNFMPWYSGTTGYHRFGSADGAFTFGFTPRDTINWQHFTTLGATSTSEQVYTYINTILRDSPTQLVANPTASGLQIGRYTTAGSLNAYIDELRFATGTRSTYWIDTEYKNQNSPAVFFATSSVGTYVSDQILDEATHDISSGGSNFYDLTINDATTSPAFTEPSVVVDGDFVVATGTVALPTGKLTVGGSFLNSGYFMHNNAEIEFISNSMATITLNGTEFLNVLYDVTFDGSGTFIFTDANATTSNDIVINDGNVVLPSGVLSIGGTLETDGGSFDANSGTVVFSSSLSENITTDGSPFYNVVFGIDNISSGWYDSDWNQRMLIKIASTSVVENANEFPVYVNLGSLDDTFWSNVNFDGSDLCMTSSNGRTRLPLEVVEIDTTLKTGEAYFLASSISATTDTSFYLYFDNADAVMPETDSVYGSEAVWINYEAVYHFSEDPTLGITDVSGHGKDLSVSVGTPSTTASHLGTALDTTSSNVMMIDSDWTWPAGENIVTSGLYFMSDYDTGALWEFGSSCSTDDCLAFLPWYNSATRGYHRVGETSYNDYDFTRDATVWHHFTTNGRVSDGEAVEIYEDTVLRDTYTQTATGENPSLTGLQIGRYTTGTYMDIDIDELRIGTTTRTSGWVETEYNNLMNTDSFYSTSVETYLEVVPSFTLNESNTDADGDVTIYYSNIIAPTDELKIGGSALNVEGSYDNNNATTTFDSNDVGETIDFGDGAFYNLSFDGVGGGWTIATTTVLNNTSLVTGTDFTLSPNTTLSVGGKFNNSFASAATTWTDSTLVLTGGDYTVTGKADSGDDYATLIVSNDSDLIMWNSSVSTSTIRDTSSLYMPDFDGTDGTLRIFGNYDRLAGTEYWSYTTDFDGTDLTGGSERMATVEIGRGSNVNLSTSTTLEIKGVSFASTSISAVSGIYSLNINAGTIDAQYFSIQDTGPDGLNLTNGTTVTNLTNAEFAVSGGRSGLTVDASTINLQPSSEFTNINFSTTTSNGIYEPEWNNQIVLTIQSNQLNETLSEFPVYVDLSTLGSDFWTAVNTDGSDIRVTTDGGVELPIDLVEIDTTTETGELYFLASELSSIEDMTFYIHFDNPSAKAYDVDDEYGSNSVWVNYEAVYHFNEDPTIRITDMTGNGRDLVPTIGTMATTTGLLGTAVDTTSGNTRLESVGWTWTAGEDLVSSGLYFQNAIDTGALWQFGVGNGTNNGTYLAFLPWYTNTTRGYHFFGITSGGDYNFTRDNSLWHHFTTIGRAADGADNEIYEDNILRDAVTQITTSANPSNTGLRIGAYQTTTYMDIQVDELRFATSTPSLNRINSEYLNLTDPTAFYATSSAQTASYNVTADGIPSAFWLFSNGTGNIYGEAFDNDDGDPGSIQWDDSNFSVTISGVVYSDDGVTPETFPICNGSTEVVTVVLDGTTSYTAPCDPVDGSYEVTGIVYTGEPQITTYINSEATETQTNVAIFDEHTATGTTAGAMMTITMPTVVDNSVVVLIAGKDDDNDFVEPAGWTEIDQLQSNSGDDITTGIWYRVVADASSEPTTYDFTGTDNGEGYSYWIASLVNVDTSSPIDASGTWTYYTNSGAPDASEITTVTNGALVLSAWYTYIDLDTVLPMGDWEDRASNIKDTAGNNLSVSSKLMEVAGATGSSTLTSVYDARESHAAQFAFKPALTPTATGSIVAAAVTKTPIGNTSSYDVVELQDYRVGYGTVDVGANIVADRPDVENGDVLVAVFGKEDDFTITPPSGWVLGDDSLMTTGNDMYTAVWYKVVNNAGTEPTTYSFLNNDTSIEEYSYWIGAFDGVDTTDVFDVTPSWSNVQNSSTPAAPGITTNTDGAYVVAAWYVIDDAYMTMPGAPWTTLADGVEQGNRLLSVAGQSLLTADTTTDASLGAGSTDDVNVIQFAIKPAPISVADGVSDMDLYQNRVIVRHEDISYLTISDMIIFDNDDDSDLPFTASAGTPDSLAVESGSGLVVWNNKTFDAGGEIILNGSGTTNSDGSILVKNSGTLMASSSDGITVGGSVYLESGATFDSASSLVNFTSTNSGQQIGSEASSTITFYDMEFSGVGGGWKIQTPVVSETDILVSTGTVSGVSDITVENGSLHGDGLVDMSDGTVEIMLDNTLGGTQGWTFNNLTLGDGLTTGITTPAGSATSTIKDTLTIETAHFLDAGSSVWDLQGNGNVFVENGTFIEDTSLIRYSGATPNILQTTYYDLTVDTDTGGTVVATAPVTGLQVLNDLSIGATGTSTLNANTNDPVMSVNGDLHIGPLGSLIASDVQTLTVNGDWNNEGVFNANNGTVDFANTIGAVSVAAGSSSFAYLNIGGTGDYTFTESATATKDVDIDTGTFVLSSGKTLAVGGEFTNRMSDINTTWSNTTLSLYGGNAYNINSKTKSDTYYNINVSSNTHPRLWNSTTTSVITGAGSSLYSMNHTGVDGDLYIFGDYLNSHYDDYWNYENDFDGVVLGSARKANVYIENGGTVLYQGGSLSVIGTSTASTSIVVQGAGNYQMTVGGTTDLDMSHYVIRDTTDDGLILAGSANINDLSNGDFEVAIADGSAMTVGGTVISANPAKEFNFIRLATTTAINAYNVKATGTSASAWRFVNVIGNLDGEDKDIDPGGDPGYLTWQDSAAIINISGTVYSDEGSTLSSVCDGITKNIHLSINGSTHASTTCDGVTSEYTFTGIGYGLSDTLTVYINDEVENAVTVTQDPISSISNFDLYENRVIIKHESGAPMTIADMGTWDSDDDSDILFDFETSGIDTLTLSSDTKLIVWDGKEFEPNGNVIVPGNGGGSAYDGTVELRTNSIFSGATGESYTIGGSLISGIGATFDAGLSTTSFTSSVGGRTIDTNEYGFHNLIFNGLGDWSVSDTELLVSGDMTIAAGDITLPAATTTISGSFDNTGGTFDANSGLILFDSVNTGNTVEFGGSDASTVLFRGTGDWTFADVNATTTDSFTVATGTVVLPSGILSVANDFVVTDTINHNSGQVILKGIGGSNLLTLNGNDLYSLSVIAGAGDYSLTDISASVLNDFTVESGTFTSGSGTLSIGGSFDVTSGTFVHNSGSVLFNSSDTGEIIDSGTNDFYNVVFANSNGGWTIANNATTTNNFSLVNANSFTLATGSVLYVGGVFANTVGGSATEWIGSTLVLDSSTEYEINNKTTSDERYNILKIGANTDVSSWNSSATSTVIDLTGSLYSQDYYGVDGDLNIYGDYHISTTTEYWSRATDFDGVALGSPRDVNVSIASSSIVSVDGGVLNMIGIANGTTTVTNQGTGRYSLFATAGTINAEHYSFENMDASGLQMTGDINVTNLDNGKFTLAQNDSTAITLASTTVNANASLIITDTGFLNGGYTGGANVSLDATTTNSWLFTGPLGNLWGENYDVDGTDECSSIRWDDSSCLLTEQAHYRWRNDDGSEGAPDSTWFNDDWSKRKRVRVINVDDSVYTDVAVKLEVTYDSDMQTDFKDLRFTDSSGTTTIDHWIEKVSTGVEADVWVEVPSMTAEDVTEIYMYYGNVTATSTSDPSEVFVTYDDFEDNDIDEYAGDTSLFNTAGTFAYGSGYGLDTAGNENSKATDGIGNTSASVEQGQIIRYMQYVDTSSGSGDEVCTMFGVQSPVTDNQNYALCIEQFGTDRISLVRDVVNTDSTGTLLGSSTVSLSTGWYEVEIDWQTDNTIDVAIYDSSGSLAATTTATDSAYTSGGIGFTFWFQHGGWDSYITYPRVDTKPTVHFGAEQVKGGATWAAAQDTVTGGFDFGDTVRLRVGIENTGLLIEDQNFQLEFAPKLNAPSCEAVDIGDFVEVPVLSSCGASAVCMTSSASTTDGDATSDHLVTDAGDFIEGEIVSDESNQTSSLDLDQDRYTELEYAIKLTSNAANDEYCFRVTDDGSALDSYALLPELNLSFDPILDTVALNGGFNISLTPNATTTVLATTTVTDLNGISDFASATTTFYTTSAGASCTPDNNNCYIASSTDCSFTDCETTSCTLTCSADFQFHADATDNDGGEEWFAFMEVSDIGGANDFDTSPGVELYTLRALDVNNAINYGVVDINENTGTYNPSTELINIGNEAIDVQISGTDMTDGVTSVISATEQLFATSTFDYNACVSCNSLSVTGVNLEVDLTKPVSDTPAVTDDVYWGIEVPFGTASNPHSGMNSFTAIAD